MGNTLENNNSGVLNEKQSKVFEFLKKSISQNGYPPSVREICAAVGFKSTSTAHRYLNMLQSLGYINKDGTKTRAIELLNSPSLNDVSFVPLVGKVTAGPPILAVENQEKLIPIDNDFLKGKKEVFMLKIKGESMIEAGVLDGDMIIVEKASAASDGEMVVALIEDESTVKFFYKEEDRIRLQPANSTMEPIYVEKGTEFAVIGKVIGLYRKY